MCMKYHLHNGFAATILCVEHLNFTQDIVDSIERHERRRRPKNASAQRREARGGGLLAKPACRPRGGLSKRAFPRQTCRNTTERPDFDWRSSYAHRYDRPEIPIVRAAARFDRG